MKRFAILITILIFVSSICIAQRIAPTVQAKRSIKVTKKQVNIRYDKPVKIIFKPNPAWPDKQFCGQGNVTLRIEFLNSGEIGKITTVSGLGYGMTESAIEAAKGIKFEPAQLKGNPVTVTKTIQFGFKLP